MPSHFYSERNLAVYPRLACNLQSLCFGHPSSWDYEHTLLSLFLSLLLSQLSFLECLSHCLTLFKNFTRDSLGQSELFVPFGTLCPLGQLIFLHSPRLKTFPRMTRISYISFFSPKEQKAQWDCGGTYQDIVRSSLENLPCRGYTGKSLGNSHTVHRDKYLASDTHQYLKN